MKRPCTFGAATALALILAAGACGVPASDRITVREQRDVPFGLLTPEATTTSTTTPESESASPVTAFMLSGGRLVAVERRISGPVSLTALVHVLAAGPTESEAAAGLRPALVPGLVRKVSLAGGIAAVDLNAPFTELPPPDQIAALAQIVYTLTARPGVGRVRFTLVEERVDTPRGDGLLTRESVAREDYAALAPA